MIAIQLLTSFFSAEQNVANADLWHECKAPWIPKRTVTGRWTLGKKKLWRRKTELGWEYLQEPQWYSR